MKPDGESLDSTAPAKVYAKKPAKGASVDFLGSDKKCEGMSIGFDVLNAHAKGASGESTRGVMVDKTYSKGK